MLMDPIVENSAGEVDENDVELGEIINDMNIQSPGVEDIKNYMSADNMNYGSADDMNSSPD